MKTYEIYDLTANIILADNLAFADVPELFEAFVSYYIGHEIIVYCRTFEVKECRRVLNELEITRKKFTNEWFDLVEELIAIGNLY